VEKEDMARNEQKSGVLGRRKRTDDAGASKTAKPADDPCRCKAVSQMTPRELIGTALNDLAFWKRRKK
jgi:hypothetical protein